MLSRAVGPRLQRLADQWGLVFLTGPRQSGKTTLARATLSDAAYGARRIPIEAKAGQTVFPNAFDGLTRWCGLANEPGGLLVYGGREEVTFKAHRARGWASLT